MVYPGGKNGAGVYQAIINQVPPHSVYVEPFLGSGAIMRNIRPSDMAIGIDRAREAGQFIAHLRHATFIEGCGITWLESRTWKGGEFVYADPPYVKSTRVRQDLYTYELEAMSPREQQAILSAMREAEATWPGVDARARATGGGCHVPCQVQQDQAHVGTRATPPPDPAPPPAVSAIVEPHPLDIPSFLRRSAA